MIVPEMMKPIMTRESREALFEIPEVTLAELKFKALKVITRLKNFIDYPKTEPDIALLKVAIASLENDPNPVYDEMCFKFGFDPLQRFDN